MARSANACAILACSWLLLVVSQRVLAIGVSISGVIVAPPVCIINGGNTLNVPFGNDLMTTRVDGVNYRRSVPYTVTCTGQPSNGMTLKLQGVGAGFNSAVLGTNNVNLGIKLFINGADWSLNNTVNFTYPDLPTMEAVPVKKPASTLSAGAFSASATLVVALQ
ncbi:fimbrial protein [Pseudomonas psychrophila]|uniref:fimbrial protein n=1 Tax=Pseudomonas psychrophila TaxID=122355 RepID=UPI0003603A0B|nr:fimbrial protein [Pseudomonas psychrophila]